MDPLFSDDGLMLTLNVTHKLRKVLQREGRNYQSELHRRVGVGLSDADFEVCVKLLVVSGWCITSTGERGAVMVTLNDAVGRQQQ